MNIKSSYLLEKDCPQCLERGEKSKLKRVVEEWNPFTDSGNGFYEIHLELCRCGYILVTKNTLEPYLKVPYRMQINEVSVHSD